jgi:hypothetical protein
MFRDRMTLVGVALAACLVAIPIGATAKEFLHQSNQGLGVTVQARPIDIGPGAKSWAFEIVLDTHSQDLADDLTRGAVLIGANGKPQAPVAWEGAAPGGHHRKGLLRFAPISPMPAVLELRIQRPGEPAPRTFRWEMK